MGARGKGKLFILGVMINSLLLKDFLERLFLVRGKHLLDSLFISIGSEMKNRGERGPNYLI